MQELSGLFCRIDFINALMKNLQSFNTLCPTKNLMVSFDKVSRDALIQ